MAVVGAVGQTWPAAGSRAAIGRIGAGRDDHFVDRVAIECVGAEVVVHFTLNGRIGDVGRRSRGVEEVGRAAGEIRLRDVADARKRIRAGVLRDYVVLAAGAELIAEELDLGGVGIVGAGGSEARAPEEEDHARVADDRAAGVIDEVLRAAATRLRPALHGHAVSITVSVIVELGGVLAKSRGR